MRNRTIDDRVWARSSVLKSRKIACDYLTSNRFEKRGIDMADTPLAFHVIANSWPLLPEKEHDELTVDVKNKGLKDKIVMYEGKILDGRNRYNAWIAAGNKPSKIPRMDLPEGECPFDWVKRANEFRRHQADGARKEARVLLASKKVTAKEGKQAAVTGSNEPVKTVAEVAAEQNETVADVKRGMAIHAKGDDSLVAAVAASEISLSLGAALANAVPDKAEQAAIVKKGKHAVRATVSEAKAKKKKDAKKEAVTETEPATEPIADHRDILRAHIGKMDIVDALEVLLDVAGTDEEVAKLLVGEFPGLIVKVLWLLEDKAAHLIATVATQEPLPPTDPVEAVTELYESLDPDSKGLVYGALVKLWDADKEVKKNGKPKRKARPTLDECVKYCKERGGIIDGEQFFNWHEQSGWKLSNGNPVVNWQAAVANWEKLERERNPERVKAAERKPYVEDEYVEPYGISQAKIDAAAKLSVEHDLV